MAELNHPDHIIYVPGVPRAKPRMTRRDKWLVPRRPAVAAYFDYCDRLVMACNARDRALPPAEQVWRLEVFALWVPPQSWSLRQQEKALGQLKRTTPDGSNVLKAIEDALWPGTDHRLGTPTPWRIWARQNATVLHIWEVGDEPPELLHVHLPGP